MSQKPLEELNGCTQGDFVAALANIFEYSPWVAEQAFAARPFGSRLSFWLPALRFPSRRFQLSAQPLVFPSQALDLSLGLLHTIAQSFDFLFQFLDSLEGYAGLCACHCRLR